MPPTQDQASLALARQIDRMCDDFESRWMAGQRPRIEDYLNPLPEHTRGKTLLALLAVELELLTRQGKLASETAYRRRFPQLESVVGQVFAIRSARASAETSVSQDSVPAPSPVATTGAPMTPQTIGRFVVVRVLGEGAFGTVYLARDPRLEREVAIKVPRLEALGGSFDTDRFLREARTAASLRHPNICPVYEADVHEGRPFIVMAYVAGQALDAVLKANKKLLSEKQAALVARRIASALQAAHDKGIVHRDLKPANVMLERERKDVVVMDFGLARGPRLPDARATQSGVIMGTPAYMSPEQARGEAKTVGPAADVYSLGVMLYEMLAGQRPFSGTVTEVLGQILHVEPQPPSKVRPGVEPQLEAICLKAMAKDPAARFASMKEFAQALDAWLRTPHGPATETAKAADTKEDAQASVGASTRQAAEVFAAMLAQQKEETAAVVGEVVRKARTPRWVFVLLGLLMVGGMAALGGIIFFAKTKSVTVLIDVDVDLSDKTLSFFLDGKPISAEELAKPVELTVGEHELVVKRGQEVVKRIRFSVQGGANPSIKVQEVQEPKAPPPPPSVPRSKDRDTAEWALGHKATVVVEQAGTEKQVSTVEELPQAGFKLLEVHFPESIDVNAIGGLEPLKGLTHLRGLGLLNAKVVDAHLKVIEGMASLRYLNLVLAPISDAGMASIATLPNLESLWLNYRPITDAGIAKIAGLKKLKELLLRRTKVGPEGLKIIGGMSELENLDLGGTQATDDSLAHLAGLRKLRHLELMGTPVTGAGLKHLAALPALSRLLLGDDQAYAGPGSLTDEGLRALAELKSVRDLYVGDTMSRRLTDQTFEHVGKLTDLAELTIYVPRATNAGLTHLKKMPQLVRLHVQGSQITDDGLAHIAGLHKLVFLWLNGTSVTGKGFVHVAKLPQLGELMASDTPLTDAGLEHLTGLRHLDRVFFHGTKLTDRGMETLAGIPSLRHVEVPRTAVTDAGLRAFKAGRPDRVTVPEPKPLAADTDRTAAEWVLSVGGNVRITDPNRIPRTIAEYHQTCPVVSPGQQFPRTPFKLSGVDLSGLIKGSNEMELARLNGLEHLVHLSLRETQVTDRGLATLTDLPNLISLSLDHTRITEEGLKMVGKFRRLEAVGLGGLPIADDGIVELSGLSNLKAAQLASTKLADQGLKHVVKWKKLEYLDIEQTQVTDNGLAELAGLPELASLWVSGPKFTGAGLRHLHNSPKLHTLLLSGSAVTDDGLAALPGLTRLGWLQMTPAHQVTDAGLKHFAEMTHLHTLWITSNSITDAGLAHLSKLDQMKDMSLTGAKLTDAGLHHLAPLWRVNVLRLNGTAVTGSGLKHLAKNGQLQRLELIEALVTDDGLAGVAEVASLQVLLLPRTRVTDAGLVHLKKLALLTYLDLTGCPVTNDGLLRLKRDLPGCQIAPEPKPPAADP